MKYVQHINELIRTTIDNSNPIVLYGQNISAGSCISGLTRGLKNGEKRLVINTPNIENTQVGIGFGLMLSGVSSVFFMKQQDFLLLGIDHLVNTYNFVRINEPSASFTIVPVVVDSGYEGIQSSLNNFSDFCSIARIAGYAITNRHDADHIVRTHLVSPGFRIIGVSQRLFQTEILSCENDPTVYNNGEIFQYYEGADITIVCFNFSFPQGMKLREELATLGLSSSLFSVNVMTPIDWLHILRDVSRTKKLIVIDDSKSVNRSCYHLTTEVYRECSIDRVLTLTRDVTDECLRPCSEEFSIDTNSIMKTLRQ